MKKLGIILFLIVSTILFGTIIQLPDYACSITSCDYDLDNDTDIFIGHNVNTGLQNQSYTVLNNDGIGEFSQVDSSDTLTTSLEKILLIKANTDDFPEMVIDYKDFTNTIPQTYFRIYYNNSGEFISYQDFLVGSDINIRMSASGFINNDEYEDIVFICGSYDTLGLMYNDCNGGLLEPEYFSFDNQINDVKCYDLDNNGLDDIIITGNYLTIYFNYGSYFNVHVIDNIGFSGFIIELDDLDNDGDTDVITSQPGMNNLTLFNLFENLNGNIEFNSYIVRNPSIGYFELSDLNNDFLPEIIMGKYDNLYIYENLGDFTISSTSIIVDTNINNTNNNVFTISTGDFDNNQYKDIVFSAHIDNEPYIGLVFNNGDGSFQNEPVNAYNELISNNDVLLTNYPNPFNPSTTIEFSIQIDSNIELSVYNIKGQNIKTIVNNEFTKGSHSIIWNGNDDSGNSVSSGIYFYKLKSGNFEKTKKMLLLK
ncbi:FG-GAP-like repeat-containing protein [Candidatus Cloacimonadota bacterium]